MAAMPAIVARPLRPEYAEELFGYLVEPDLYAFIPDEPPAGIAELRGEFERLSAGSPSGRERWLNWVMFDGAQAVGTLQATVRERASASIAYVVFRPFWGRGYATAGVRWLLRELFMARGVETVTAEIDARNARSLAVVRAVGMQPGEEHDGECSFVLSRAGWRDEAQRL